ncbi:hypothetical protein JXA56_03830 [Candidatus Micrarchaeota archaeon]|nr:hypothetical protein [Candidatus Micrarchaeota archaeon]
MSVEEILNEMKEKGIGGAVVRSDGMPVASTIALKESDASLFSLVANTADALLQKMDDRPRELEVSFNGLILVMVPLKNHVFCGLVKNRDEKQIVLQYAEQAGAQL